MEEVFRSCTLTEVRQKYKQLGIERSNHKVESSQTLGAAYPEILDLCDQISALCESAVQHETALSKLSSVESLGRWRKISENTQRYYREETESARQRALTDLVAWIQGQIERQVAEGALLGAARLYYLLNSLSTPPKTSLDSYLDSWLEKPSDDLDTIVAYILRYQVPPSQVAQRLAKHRLAQLKQLPVLEAVHLMDQTVASLDYIADYQLKFKSYSSKLVDVIDIDRSILPKSALELPLYPACFTQQGTFEKSEFIQQAETALHNSVEKFIGLGTAADIVALYSVLARDSPQLASKTHSVFVERLEALISEISSYVEQIKVPEHLDQPQTFDLTRVDSIVEQVRGQSGTLEEPLGAIYQWHEDINKLQSQLHVLEALESRVPALKGAPKQLESTLQAATQSALKKELLNISKSKNYGAAIIMMQALDKSTPLLEELYERVAEQLVGEWQLDTNTTVLTGFPSRGLLKSLNKLVDAMDNVAVGFEWSEPACQALRKKAAAKLRGQFGNEMNFVYELFGLAQAKEESEPKESEPKEPEPKEFEPKESEPKESEPKKSEPKEKSTEPSADEESREEPRKETTPEPSKSKKSKKNKKKNKQASSNGPKETEDAKETETTEQTDSKEVESEQTEGRVNDSAEPETEPKLPQPEPTDPQSALSSQDITLSCARIRTLLIPLAI